MFYAQYGCDAKTYAWSHKRSTPRVRVMEPRGAQYRLADKKLEIGLQADVLLYCAARFFCLFPTRTALTTIQ